MDIMINTDMISIDVAPTIALGLALTAAARIGVARRRAPSPRVRPCAAPTSLTDMIVIMPEREPEVTDWAPPPLDDCDEDRMSFGLDDAYVLSCRRVLWNQQLVAFAVVLSRKVGDRSLEVVCIDTLNHGCVHRHDGDHNAPFKVVRQISSQQDVQESFHDAYDEVYDEYLKITGLD